QDLVPLNGLRRNFAISLPSLMQPSVPADRRSAAEEALRRWNGEGGAIDVEPTVTTAYPCELEGQQFELHDGSVVIAAITSCTNTSNPSVMVGAGLLAKRAVELGLRPRPWVKTSMAPGSRVVTEYLDKADLTRWLDQLGFNTVGYGCTTCRSEERRVGKECRSRWAS